MFRTSLTFYLCVCSVLAKTQSLQHPIIWATIEEREDILDLTEEYDWANQIVNEVQEIVNGKVKVHLEDPAPILREIPKISKDDNIRELQVTTVHEHTRVLTLASYAALLYYLSEEESYAQFAADILWYYAEELAERSPHTTSICGNSFYDARTSYAQFAIAYDFIYNFLKRPKASVFSASKNSRVAYDHSTMQKAVLNMVGNVLQEYGHADKHGKFISNHPILTAPGALLGVLCVEDDAERERLFNLFWEKGTAHQNSFKHTILPMFGRQGIWPESTSYSFMPYVTMILNIIDRLKPELNVMKDNMHILEGNFLFDNLRMPDRRFVTYGDSHRDKDGTETLYRYTLHLSIRRGFKDYERRAKQALRQSYDAKGGYRSNVEIKTFGNFAPFTKLLWGIPIPEKIEGEIDFQKPTVIIEHAGVALQRNYVEENNKLFGLCGIIGGAHYVHSHVSGISMELYGAEYVMAPQAGLPSTVAQRRIPLHEHYFRLYAGNNTVIVNGASRGRDQGSWKQRANVWQNTVVNIAAEPQHLEEPKNENFSFATQLLNDEVNNAVQQRTLSVVRTSPHTAYYFDLFRSRSLQENKFHDYIYHNLGENMVIKAAGGEEIELYSTDRYNNDIGDQVRSPGWKFFENTETTKATNEGVKVRYHLKHDDRYMHQFIPGGVLREYTQALAPASRDVRNGYTEQKTQVLAIRQTGEAWDRPYISIFEPSTNEQSSVKLVEPLYSGASIVGAKVISQVDEREIVDFIICLEKSDLVYELPELNLRFQGRFGIARLITQKNDIKTELYMGEGESFVMGEVRAD